jgi:ectoine hydroxylase-related dioxygenase (phytanoyl-CoA dioxygenase family)
MHRQYVRLTRAQLREFATERPQLKPGDLLIWDSRTAHRVARQTAGAMRAVMYLSYVPRAFAKSSSLGERRSFFNKGVCATHWPHRTVDRGEERIPPSQGYAKAAESARRLIDGDTLKGTKASQDTEETG